MLKKVSMAIAIITAAAIATPVEAAQKKASAKATKKPSKPAKAKASAGGTYYANCSAARAAGAAPVMAGDPGYSRKLDRDGDGIGCE